MNGGFFEPLSQALAIIIDLLPRLFALVVILLLGLIVAWLVRRSCVWLGNVLRMERWGQKLGLRDVFSALRLERPLPVIVADILYALLLIVFLVVGIDALNPTQRGNLVQAFYDYLPQLLVALLILIIAYVVSVFVSQWVLVAAVNAQWKAARGISAAVQFLVLTLGLSMALEQLGIAEGIVVAAFALSFGGIVLALSLAFGIGGAELAKRALEHRLGNPQAKDRPDEFSHL